MSHTVHPYAHRLGILRDWKSRWFTCEKNYREFLKTDILLREWLETRMRGNFVDGIEMERSANTYRIIIKTSRPGMVICRQGEGTQKLRADIMKQIARHKLSIPKEVKIDIEEIRVPDMHSCIVGQQIASELERRLPFKRVMKQAAEKVMGTKGVLGCRITLSGRLGGAEMSRVETLKRGRLPLQTLRADIDFARVRAHLSYGDIGIKVWIYKGDIFSRGEKTETEHKNG